MEESTIYTAYPQNEEQKEAFIKFMESLNIPFEEVEVESEEEDQAMIKAIDEGKETELVSKETIFKTLGK